MTGIYVWAVAILAILVLAKIFWGDVLNRDPLAKNTPEFLEAVIDGEDVLINSVTGEVVPVDNTHAEGVSFK